MAFRGTIKEKLNQATTKLGNDINTVVDEK